MFDGLTSRWIRPSACAASRASAICDVMSTARSGVIAPGLQHLRQVGALDEAHVDVEQAVDLAVVVDRDDVRFAQLGRQRGLPLEPRAELAVLRHLPREPLEGDDAVAALVPRTEHLAHSAAADQALEPVVTEPFGDHRLVRTSQERRHDRPLGGGARLARRCPIARPVASARTRAVRGLPRSIIPSSPSHFVYGITDAGLPRGKETLPPSAGSPAPSEQWFGRRPPARLVAPER